MDRKTTAAAVMALMLGLGAAPVLAQSNGAQPQVTLETLMKRPDELQKEGKYAEALEAAEEFARAAEKSERAKGKPGKITAVALNTVAWNALFAKRFDRALEATAQAQAIASSRADPSYMFIQGNRAYALMFSGRMEEALAIFIEHKGEPLGKAGKWEEVVAKDFDELRKAGVETPQMTRAAEAMAAAADSPHLLLLQALELNKASKGEEAFAALEKYGQAVKARRGEAHADYAEYLRTLGKFLKQAGKNAEAEQPLRQALVLDEKAFGAENINVINDIGELASVLNELNRRDEAEPFMRRVVALTEAVSGKEDVWVGVRLNNLALLLVATNRLAEAETLERRAVAIIEKVFGPDHQMVAMDLTTLSEILRRLNRFAEAEEPARRALAIIEKLNGPEHPDVADSLESLGKLLKEASRFAEAEPLYRRALGINEKSYGAEHLSVAMNLNNLAGLLRETNRLGEAEAFYRRALAIFEKNSGPDHRNVATAVNNLASTLQESNKFAEAEPLYRRAIVIAEKNFGPDHSEVATSLGNLAGLLEQTNRLAEAETLMRRALTIDEKSYGPDDANVALRLNNLGLLFKETNRLAEAEPLLRRALTIVEKSYGSDHPATARSLNNLASLLNGSNRFVEAEPLYRRALAIEEKSYGPDHPRVARRLNNLGLLLQDTSRLAEAEPLLRRALAIDEKSYGPDHPSVATTANNLAYVLEESDRLAEAEALYRRALAINEKSYGAEHPAVARNLSNLGLLFGNTNRFAEAGPMLRRSLAINEKSYGLDHPQVARVLGILSLQQGLSNDWTGALSSIRQASSIYVASARLMRSQGGDAEKRELAGNAYAFKRHALIAYRAARNDPAVRDEAFAMAQRATASDAAGALAQATARFAVGDSALAALAREQQDLARQRDALDKRLLDALGKADKAATEAARAEQVKIDARLKEIAAKLEKEHPDYAGLVNPEPLTVAQTQALLAPDEIFVQFIDSPTRPHSPVLETAFVFVIAKNEARWLELPLGPKAMDDKVTALRCGLDSSAWKDASNRCSQLLGKPAPGEDLPPFDLARAHELYRDLFGQVEDSIKDKRLLIAPTGALARLPFQALVTEAPDPAAKGADAYAKARWLGARNAVSVMPAAASLKQLRLGKQGLGKQGLASDPSVGDPSSRDPFMGFGNPLLNGGGGDRSAWSKQACGKAAAPQSIKRSANRAAPLALADVYHDAVADVEMLRKASPLPETADELCAVARNLGAPDGAVYLGERATVSQIKALSASGALGRARTLHFATHGLVAGETALFLRNRAEPALLMTPPAPDKVSPEDDGLLKASDVTGLKLNADWVVMSACNTAAGAEGGEALSGLARAFFYAGARSMLVSHWYVDSAAAVEITTGAFSSLKADPDIGRDEALRRSLVRLIAKGGDSAHPSIWAPFVLVGDGGRGAVQTAASGAATPPVAAGAAASPSFRSAENALAQVIKLNGAGQQTISTLAFSADGRELLVVTRDGAITAWDAQTGEIIRKQAVIAGNGRAVTLSGDGRVVASGDSARRSVVSFWDAQSGQPKGSISANPGNRLSKDAVALSPDGQRLAAEQYGVPASSPSIGIWDVPSGKQLRILEGKFGDVHSLAFSHDNRRLAVIDAKGVLSIWDAQTGKAAGPAIPAAARQAAFSPDGQWLASAGAGREVKLWDAKTGSRVKVIASRAEAVSAVTFSPDGRLLVAAPDGTVELWEQPAQATGASGGGR